VGDDGAVEISRTMFNHHYLEQCEY